MGLMTTDLFTDDSAVWYLHANIQVDMGLAGRQEKPIHTFSTGLQ